MSSAFELKVLDLDLRRGTGPLVCEGDGATASVIDIISKILANEPRALVILDELTRLVLSSSISLGSLGLEVLPNVSSESCVTLLRLFRPGSRVRHRQ